MLNSDVSFYSVDASFFLVSRADHISLSSTNCFIAGLMSEVKFPDFLHGSEVEAFIEQLLAKDPNNRPQFNEIRTICGASVWNSMRQS